MDILRYVWNVLGHEELPEVSLPKAIVAKNWDDTVLNLTNFSQDRTPSN